MPTVARLPGLPTHVSLDRTLRVKILDTCGMTCTFCHNEGTPVTADALDQQASGFSKKHGSGRVSIYVPDNGARFLAARMPADDTFTHALTALRKALDFTEVHLTGGEPTLHPHLAALTRLAIHAGYQVGMTSNGEHGAARIPEAARAGLERVNFSVFGTTPDELAAVQHTRFRNPALAARKISALREAIATCAAHDVHTSANIVVLNHNHIPRVHRLLDDYAPTLSIRLLNSLEHGNLSLNAIDTVLRQRRAVPEAHYLTAGASSSRTAYRLPDGRRIFVKQIRPIRLPDTCASCRFNNATDCQEGYYGVRLYYDTHSRYQVGVCIQRMDLCLPLDEFLTSPLPEEIRALRDNEYRQLTVRNTG
jgi:cyclic pyranopterin phosphate synthase